jgi:hypothetical protein
LDARKTIFHQDDGNDGASVFGGEGDADSKSIEEIVNEGRE